MLALIYCLRLNFLGNIVGSATNCTNLNYPCKDPWCAAAKNSGQKLERKLSKVHLAITKIFTFSQSCQKDCGWGVSQV